MVETTGVTTGSADSGPDLLTMFEAIVKRDPRAPGFEGRLGVALLDPAGGLHWWLATFQKHHVHTRFSEDRGAGAECESVWLMEATPPLAPGVLSAECVQTRALAGDVQLFRHFEARYLAPGQTSLGLRTNLAGTAVKAKDKKRGSAKSPRSTK